MSERVVPQMSVAVGKECQEASFCCPVCVCVTWSLFKAAGIMPGNKFFWIKTFRVHLAKKLKDMFLEKGLLSTGG